MPLFCNACTKAAIVPVSLDTQLPAQSRTSAQALGPTSHVGVGQKTPLHILLIVKNSSVLNASIVRFARVPPYLQV